MVDYKKNIIKGSLTLLDIGIYTIIYFTIGFYISHYINLFYSKFYSNTDKLKIIIFLEVCSQLLIIGILMFTIQYIVQLIPFPLHGVYGYNHKIVKSLYGNTALSFGIYYGQDDIEEKLQYIIS